MRPLTDFIWPDRGSMLLFAFAWRGLGYNQGQMRRVEQLMAFHQFWNAYQELTTIISQERDRVDNQVYRLRAQCCLNMAMVKECIDDTKKILKNSPSADDKKYAYLLQARALMQKGDFFSAEEAAKKSQDRQLIRNCQDLQRMETNAADKAKRGQIGEAAQLYDQLLRNAPKASHIVLERANIAWLSSDFGRYKELTNDLEKEFPNDGTLVYRRGIVSFCDGQMEPAMQRLRKAQGIRGSPKNCSEALRAVQDVNKYYPETQGHIDGKKPDAAEKTLRVVKRAAEDYCPQGSVLMNSVNMLDLKLIKAKHTPEETLDILNAMVGDAPDSIDLMLERGDLQLELGDFDAALFDYSNVQRRNPGNQRAQEGINKAQELKKKATYVDHYKVLGLEKGASESQIKSAYKKMVIQWHPDRYGDKTKKKEAEVMMKKINQAYDVLGDPEKKRLYDAGQDPDDPMAGRQDFGFNPFDMFFNGGGGGGGGQHFQFGNGQGFHFEFHF